MCTRMLGARIANLLGVAVVASAVLLEAGAAGAVLPSAFSLDPRRTYLLTNSDAPLDALTIDLGALGIESGMTIRLERLGGFDCGPPCVDDRVGMVGVFSAGTVLLATNQRHRVPGAIDAGVDFVTSQTYFGGVQTDIPEDFAIADTTVRVPDGATHLFVGAHDSLYVDNTDPNGDFAVRVSLENPTAVDDSYSVDEDQTLDVAAPGVLANDSDPQAQALTAVLLTGPAHGGLTLNADGSFAYTPDANFNGADSFSYRASDGGADSAQATVAIAVNPVDDAPVASADGPYLGIVGSPVTFDGSASWDVEGSALAYTWSFGDGSTLVTTSATPAHAYAAAGTYTVTLVVSDGALDSAPATTTATIGDPIGSNRGDVDAFLSYATPTERSTQLPAGTSSADVTIVYGGSIMTGTFAAELNGRPFAGFSPAPATSQTVTIPLSPGRNVLAISVDGTLADGRRATDRDRLTFVVG